MIDSLFRIIKILRGKNGCPWDKKQTPTDVSLYITEEAFELAEAVDSNDPEHICEETGDVLFQLLMIVRMFEEKGDFCFNDVCTKVSEKMIRRHAHVFGEKKAANAQQAYDSWCAVKKAEKKDNPDFSVIDSIPKKLPALMRAFKISERAARTGFDWEDISGVIEKVEEEWNELKEELAKKSCKRNTHLEFGDVLFTLVNLARFADIHPETVLNAAIKKFENRFKYMEKELFKNQEIPEGLSQEDFDSAWNQAKLKIY